MSKALRDGQGSITQTADGRFWARAPRQPDGSRPSLGKHLTYAAAERALEAGVAVRSAGGLKREGLPSFVDFAATILDEREEDGVRGIDNERSRFRTHIATAHWAKYTLDAVQPSDITEWLRVMSRKKAHGKETKLELTTIQASLTLASAIFEAAGPNDRNLIERNPCVGLEVKRKAGEEATREKWTFFTAKEEEWFSRPRVTSNGYVRESERLALLFGESSGVRQGEQFHLHLDDLHTSDTEECTHDGCKFAGMKKPHAVIRFGSKGLPRKNGKILYIPVFGLALIAAREWLRMRELLHIPGELVFPLPSGKPRRRSKPLGNGRFVAVEDMFRLFKRRVQGTHVWGQKNPVRAPKGKGTLVYLDRWKEVLLIAGIKRNVRWHDVRHTCASALAQGRWGEKWDLREIQEQLGHSSSQMTERYSHLAKNALANAADKIRVGSALVTSDAGNGGAGSSVAAISSEFEVVEQRGIEPLTSALRTPGTIELLRALARKNDSSNQLVTNLAGALIAALEVGHSNGKADA